MLGNLGRTLDNLGKDIRTVAISFVGVGDSVEVYAMGRTASGCDLFKIGN